jgi:tryptophan synthase beta subunit
LEAIKVSFYNVIKVVEGLFKKCDQEELLKFAGLARRIWLRRNDVIHGGKFSYPNTMWQQTLSSIQELALAHKKEKHTEQANGHHGVNQWQAPAENCCKGN